MVLDSCMECYGSKLTNKQVNTFFATNIITYLPFSSSCKHNNLFIFSHNKINDSSTKFTCKQNNFVTLNKKNHKKTSSGEFGRT